MGGLASQIASAIVLSQKDLWLVCQFLQLSCFGPFAEPFGHVLVVGLSPDALGFRGGGPCAKRGGKMQH